jgi:hypothetical protein
MKQIYEKPRMVTEKFEIGKLVAFLSGNNGEEEQG